MSYSDFESGDEAQPDIDPEATQYYHFGAAPAATTAQEAGRINRAEQIQYEDEDWGTEEFVEDEPASSAPPAAEQEAADAAPQTRVNDVMAQYAIHDAEDVYVEEDGDEEIVVIRRKKKKPVEGTDPLLQHDGDTPPRKTIRSDHNDF